MKHTIWTNELDYKDWKDDLEEQYPDEDGYDEDDRMQIMYETNNDYLDDEKANLNKELGRPIVIIANLGLWNGRRAAYKITGSNLNDIFSETCGDYVTWYVEDGEVKCDDTHHDGTNHYLYRVLKQEYTKEDFEDYTYDTNIFIAEEMMTEPLGKYVAEIYGFKLEENHD